MKDQELDQLLELAQSSVPTSAGFQHEVWRRIEAAETKAWKPHLKPFAERFFSWLELPPVAIATCSVMLAAGTWVGLRSGNPAPQGELTYIQSISPFAQSHR